MPTGQQVADEVKDAVEETKEHANDAVEEVLQTSLAVPSQRLRAEDMKIEIQIERSAEGR